jgi:phosphoribosylamine-glycine ligase
VASHKGDPVQWMKDLCLGRDSLRVDYRPAIGVVMAQPPYPYDEACVVAPIQGLDESNIDSVHLVSAMIGRGPVMADKKVVDGPCIKTTAEYVLCATGHGRTVELARRAVYRVVDASKFPDALYRTDIGEKVEPVLPKLHSWGYAKDMQYK